MIHQQIHLNKYYDKLENDPILISYCPDNFKEFSIGKVRKCVLILPGGAYAFVSEREAEPVALRFNGQDIACFVLKYTIAPALKYPNPFVEVFAALSYIRRNADFYHIDVDKIAVLGFSAGGHLAAGSSAFCEQEEYANYLNIPLSEMKINGCMLSYPVISSEYGHEESIKNITQGRDDLKEKMSLEKQVTPSFPKTFIWHTTFDNAVILKNSLALAMALHENKVFLEMHIYPMLDHGQSLCDASVYGTNMDKETLNIMKYNTQWIENAIHFVKEYL